MSDLKVMLSLQKLKDYPYLSHIEDIVNVLPHGSGFDGDWVIDLDNEEYPESFIFSNGYHAMDGNGMYSGWLMFDIFVGKDDGLNESNEFNPKNWFYKFEIDYDESNLDYDDGTDEYEITDDDVDEDGNLTEDGLKRQEEWEVDYSDNGAVNLDSLIEYIEQTISESLSGITGIVIDYDE